MSEQSPKYDLFGPLFGTRRLAEGIIAGLTDLAEHVCVDIREGEMPESVKKRIEARVFKSTSSGVIVGWPSPSITQPLSTVHVRGDCRGVKGFFYFQSSMFVFGQSSSVFDAMVRACDLEGSDAWRQTHGCEGCGEPDPATGWRRVNVNCPNCGGTGIVQP